VVLGVLPYLLPSRRKHLRHARELAAPDDRFVHVDGFNMRYQMRGERGTPIILIHGFASSSVTWYRNRDELARDHRVYTPDLKGWGLTDKPSDGDYSMLAQAHHLNSFMRALEIEQAVLVGHSMGGAIAVHMAVEYPQVVRGIVLIDPAGARPFPYLWLVSRVMDVPPLRRWAKLCADLVVTHEPLMSMGMPGAYYNPDNLTDEMRAALLAPYRTHGFVDALIAFTRDVRYTRLHERAAQVNCPTLIIWGEHDAVLPASDGQYFQESIGNSRLVIVREAAHLPHEEKPDEVNRLIREFVAELDSRSRNVIELIENQRMAT